MMDLICEELRAASIRYRTESLTFPNQPLAYKDTTPRSKRGGNLGIFLASVKAGSCCVTLEKCQLDRKMP